MSRSVVRDVGFTEPSLPRSNGAVVFDAPWQARAHAMAVLLVESAGCGWDEFRRLLIDGIAAEPDRPYWECWVGALERFVDELALLG